MTLDEKIRFALGTIRPMGDDTFPYLVSILGAVDAQTGRLVGSGLRVILGDRRYVLTAHHVLEQAKTYPAFAISTHYGARPYQFQTQTTVFVDANSDLALLELPEAYFRSANDSPLPCWPWNRVDKTPDRRPRDYLFLQGFPGHQSYSSQSFEGVFCRSLPYGAMELSDGRPQSLRPFEFAIRFDPRNVKTEQGTKLHELPDPPGLSGSPVWRMGASGRFAKDWEPEWSSLVGVVTQWRQDAEVLIATDSQTILQLAERAMAQEQENVPQG